jgi:hypothetical protein
LLSILRGDGVHTAISIVLLHLIGIHWMQRLLVCSSNGVHLLHGAPINKVPVLSAVEAQTMGLCTGSCWILLDARRLWRSWTGCLRVGAIRRVTWTLWRRILPLQLKLIVKTLQLELVALRWHGWLDSVGAMVEWTLWLHWTGAGVSIGLLSRVLQLPLPIHLYLCLLAFHDDGLLN